MKGYFKLCFKKVHFMTSSVSLWTDMLSLLWWRVVVICVYCSNPVVCFFFCRSFLPCFWQFEWNVSQVGFSPWAPLSAAAAVRRLSCLLICLHICGANNVLTTRWHHPDVRGICLLQPTKSNLSHCSSCCSSNQQTARINSRGAANALYPHM